MIIRQDPLNGLTDQELKMPIIGMFSLVDGISVSSEDENFPIDNLNNVATHLRWQSVEDQSGDINIDISTDADTINYVAFVGHNFLGYQVSVQAYIPDSPGDFFTLIGPTDVTDSGPLILEFEEGDYEIIRVTIIGDGTRYAANMYCGLLLRMDRSVRVDQEQTPTRRGQKTDVLTGFSENGNFLGRLVRNSIYESKLSFNNIDRDFYAEEMHVWVRFFLPTVPFFLAWAPDDYPEETAYVWTTNDPIPTQNMMTRNYSLALELRGFA